MPRTPGRSRLRPALIVAGVLAFVLLVAVAATFAFAREVRGDSMEPTLSDGDRVVEQPDSGGAVSRFDVVVLRPAAGQSLIVKRVVAVAGDRVTITSSNRVLVRPAGRDGWYRVDVPRWSDRTALGPCCTADGRRGRAAVRTVPRGRFFYLGDNPAVSEDSRTFGWGRVADVDGRVWFSAWPPGGVGNAPRLVPVADR